MPRSKKPATGGIPNFAITLPDDEYLDLVGELRSTPGVESMCLSTTQDGTQVIIVGATFEEALEHVDKKAAIALKRIKLKETMKVKKEEERNLRNKKI